VLPSPSLRCAPDLYPPGQPFSGYWNALALFPFSPFRLVRLLRGCGSALFLLRPFVISFDVSLDLFQVGSQILYCHNTSETTATNLFLIFLSIRCPACVLAFSRGFYRAIGGPVGLIRSAWFPLRIENRHPPSFEDSQRASPRSFPTTLLPGGMRFRAKGFWERCSMSLIVPPPSFPSRRSFSGRPFSLDLFFPDYFRPEPNNFRWPWSPSLLVNAARRIGDFLFWQGTVDFFPSPLTLSLQA